MTEGQSGSYADAKTTVVEEIITRIRAASVSNVSPHRSV